MALTPHHHIRDSDIFYILRKIIKLKIKTHVWAPVFVQICETLCVISFHYKNFLPADFLVRLPDRAVVRLVQLRPDVPQRRTAPSPSLRHLRANCLLRCHQVNTLVKLTFSARVWNNVLMLLKWHDWRLIRWLRKCFKWRVTWDRIVQLLNCKSYFDSFFDSLTKLVKLSKIKPVLNSNVEHIIINNKNLFRRALSNFQLFNFPVLPATSLSSRGLCIKVQLTDPRWPRLLTTAPALNWYKIIN